jgi:ELWxxDGT repeat protein
MPQLALFEGSNASGQYGLWVTDGTAANTLELTGIIGANTNGLAPSDLTVFNGEVLFNGTDTNGQNGLWVTNGTAAGTSELTGITGANSTGLAPSDLTVFNGEVLFEATDTNGQYGLWVTNGAAAATHELTGIASANTVEGLWPSNMTVFNGEVLFNGYDLNGQYGLWVTDGTAANTLELTGIIGANTNGLAPSDLTVFNGEVLFEGTDTNGQNGLWVTNGTAAGTHELTGITGANSNGLSPSNLTVFNGEVLFSGVDASGQYGLWVTDGTAAGTHELSGISTANSNGASLSDITSATLNLATAPPLAVEGSMYNAVGSQAEVTSLTNQFVPSQETNATNNGLNPVVYGCEALGLVFAFGNETGSTAFSNNFGPSNPAMPNTTVGDAAFATAAASTIFGSASTTNLINVMESYISFWKGFFTANGVSGYATPTAAQIDLAARGTAWGDMVGVALANNLGPLSGEVNNFLNDAAQGTAVYGASLVGQPAHQPFQGA